LIISMYKDTKIKRNLNKIWYITKDDNYLPLQKETIQN